MLCTATSVFRWTQTGGCVCIHEVDHKETQSDVYTSSECDLMAHSWSCVCLCDLEKKTLNSSSFVLRAKEEGDDWKLFIMEQKLKDTISRENVFSSSALLKYKCRSAVTLAVSLRSCRCLSCSDNLRLFRRAVLHLSVCTEPVNKKQKIQQS